MDNYRLDEIASAYNEVQLLDETNVAKEARIKETISRLEERVKSLEERMNLLMALKSQGLDLSKFCFDIKPL